MASLVNETYPAFSLIHCGSKLWITYITFCVFAANSSSFQFGATILRPSECPDKHQKTTCINSGSLSSRHSSRKISSRSNLASSNVNVGRNPVLSPSVHSIPGARYTAGLWSGALGWYNLTLLFWRLSSPDSQGIDVILTNPQTGLYTSSSTSILPVLSTTAACATFSNSLKYVLSSGMEEATIPQPSLFPEIQWLDHVYSWIKYSIFITEATLFPA